MADWSRGQAGNRFLSGPILPPLVKFALPLMLSLLLQALYGGVDLAVVGRFSPTESVAAVATGSQVMQAATVVVTGLTMGVTVLRGKAIGAGDRETAGCVVAGQVRLFTLVAVVMTLVMVTFAPQAARFMNVPEYAIPETVRYVRICSGGMVFITAYNGISGIFRGIGNSRSPFLFVSIACVVNIVLDLLFVGVFHLDASGAALATVIAQAVSAVWVVCFLKGRRTKLRLQRRFARLDWKVLSPVLALGVAPFIMQSTESLVNIAFNSSLKAYGGDPAVGAMTICSSIMQVFYLLFQGLSQGAKPIVGYNYGAGNLDRVKKTFRLLFVCALTFSTLSCLAIELFPGVFVAMFNDKPELVEIAVWTLRVYAAGMFMLGVQNACQQTFVALGQAKISLFLALLRKIILLIPLVYILPHFLGNKVLAVFLAEPAADILAAVTTGSLFFWRFPRLLSARAAELRQQSA